MTSRLLRREVLRRAGIFEVVAALGWRECVEQRSDHVPEFVTGTRCSLSQQRLQLGEHLLDRVEIRTVGWKIQNAWPGGSDCLGNAGDLVRAEIIHHHDITWSERRCKELLDISAKRLAGHRSIKDERGNKTSGAKPCHKGRGVPVPVRRGIDQALPARMPAVVSHHAGAGPGLIDKHE